VSSWRWALRFYGIIIRNYERTDVIDTAQLAVSIRGVNENSQLLVKLLDPYERATGADDFFVWLGDSFFLANMNCLTKKRLSFLVTDLLVQLAKVTVLQTVLKILKNSRELLSLVSTVCCAGRVSLKRMTMYVIPQRRDTVQYSFKLMMMMMMMMMMMRMMRRMISYLLHLKTPSIARRTLDLAVGFQERKRCRLSWLSSRFLGKENAVDCRTDP
jgi:hypothetical protein